MAPGSAIGSLSVSFEIEHLGGGQAFAWPTVYPVAGRGTKFRCGRAEDALPLAAEAGEGMPN